MTRRTRLRVLVAAPAFLPWDLGVHVESALADLGHHTSRVQCEPLGRPADVGRAFVAAVRAEKPDVVVGLKMQGVPAAAIVKARRAGARVVLWQVDCFTDRVPRWIVPIARAVDAVAVTAEGMVPAYARLGSAPVQWIVEGARVEAFPRVHLTAAQRRLYGAEIAFVGGVRQPPVANLALASRRAKLLERLAKSFTVRVWGPQRRGVEGWARSAGIVLTRWPAYNDELVRVCQASAIVLGVNTINTVPRYFSDRTFFTLASGGFHLTHYVPGLETLFENHRHLVWFNDDEECADLCRFYLRRPAARARIAAAGRRLVRKRWTLTSQVSQLLALGGGDRHGA